MTLGLGLGFGVRLRARVCVSGGRASTSCALTFENPSLKLPLPPQVVPLTCPCLQAFGDITPGDGEPQQRFEFVTNVTLDSVPMGRSSGSGSPFSPDDLYPQISKSYPYYAAIPFFPRARAGTSPNRHPAARARAVLHANPPLFSRYERHEDGDRVALRISL